MDYGKKVESRNRYSFNVGYEGTDENAETHKRFQQFCAAYDNVYISGLRVLLDNWEMRHEYEMILGLINDLQQVNAVLGSEIEELKQLLTQKEDKKVMKTFGKGE